MDFAALLHETVRSRHYTIDARTWSEIIVIGDVHGCIDELHTLLETLAPGANDLLVFVGDLVGDGPDNSAVVNLVRNRDNMLSVCGDSENGLLPSQTAFNPNTVEYLASLPLVISWDSGAVIHAGINPTRPIQHQPPATLLSCRSIPPENGYDGPFWFEYHDGPPFLMFGHTVLEHPLRTNWAVGVNTGCVHGGALTAYNYHMDNFVSVPASQSYTDNPPPRFVDPDELDL